MFEMHAHSESDIVGSQIRVQKLTKSARYIGSLATVDSFDRCSHCYTVKLEGSLMLKMIRPDCVRTTIPISAATSKSRLNVTPVGWKKLKSWASDNSGEPGCRDSRDTVFHI